MTPVGDFDRQFDQFGLPHNIDGNRLVDRRHANQIDQMIVVFDQRPVVGGDEVVHLEIGEEGRRSRSYALDQGSPNSIQAKPLSFFQRVVAIELNPQIGVAYFSIDDQLLSHEHDEPDGDREADTLVSA